MKKISEKMFINVISNIIICTVILSVIIIGFGNEIVYTFDSDTLKPIYHGDETKPNVTLMVNVYWGTEFIEDMLKEFEKFDVKTTFFVGGTWAEHNEDMLKNIYNKGHEIANHGYFHKDHKKINSTRNREEIYNTQQMIYSICGITTKYFAPPSGAFSQTTLEVAKELGYTSIMWSKDTVDWRDKDNSIIFKRATNNIKNGDLVLMHPTKETLVALTKILQYYKANGFKVVPISENI